MRKTSRILFLIGGIYSIVTAISYLIVAIVMFVLGSDAFKEARIGLINEGSVKSDLPGTPEEIATALQIVYRAIGGTMMPWVALSVLSAIFAFKARGNNPSRALCVLNIVFSTVAGVIVNGVGGVFALIAEEVDKPENNDPLNNNVVEAEVAEEK